MVLAALGHRSTDDSILPIVLVLIAALAIIVGFVVLWRRARRAGHAGGD